MSCNRQGHQQHALVGGSTLVEQRDPTGGKRGQGSWEQRRERLQTTGNGLQRESNGLATDRHEGTIQPGRSNGGLDGGTTVNLTKSRAKGRQIRDEISETGPGRDGERRIYEGYAGGMF